MKHSIISTGTSWSSTDYDTVYIMRSIAQAAMAHEPVLEVSHDHRPGVQSLWSAAMITVHTFVILIVVDRTVTSESRRLSWWSDITTTRSGWSTSVLPLILWRLNLYRCPLSLAHTYKESTQNMFLQTFHHRQPERGLFTKRPKES